MTYLLICKNKYQLYIDVLKCSIRARRKLTTFCNGRGLENSCSTKYNLIKMALYQGAESEKKKDKRGRQKRVTSRDFKLCKIMSYGSSQEPEDNKKI